MPRNIETRELKAGLSEILDRVRAGEVFTITECGEPVADLLPSRSVSGRKTAVAIEDIKAGMSETIVSDDLLKGYVERGRD